MNMRCDPATIGQKTTVLTITGDDTGQTPDYVNTTCTARRSYISLSNSADIDFGDVVVGSTVTVSRSITNLNDSFAMALNASLAASPARFTSSITSVTDLAPGNNVTFQIRFTPTTAGLVTGSLVITSDDPDAPSIAINLTGRGVEPVATVVLPATGVVQFGKLEVGTTSAGQTVRIRNDGNGDLTISGVIRTGASPGQFGHSPSTPPNVVLAPGTSADWTVTCSPTSTGQKSATLRFANDSVFDPLDVPLNCEGVEAEVAVSPSPVAFGKVRVCEALDIDVNLQNTGLADLTVANLVLSSARYGIVSGLSAPFTLGPSASTAQRIRFAPTADGQVNGMLTIISNSPNSPSVVNLTATGVVAQMGIDATSHDFDNVRVDQAFPSQLFTITNTGTADFQLLSLALSNTNDFAVTSVSPASLPSTLSPTQTATFRVTAQPQSLGAASALLTVNTDIPNAPCGMPPTVVSLAANGVDGHLTLDPASPLDLGPACIGGTEVRQSVRATNTGIGTITISTIAIDDKSDFELDLTGVPLNTPIDPAQGFTFDVISHPQTEGALSGTVSIGSDAPGTSSLVVTAVGLRSGLGIAPSSVDFGSSDIGVRSAEQSVTALNCEPGTAVLTGVTISDGEAADFTVTSGQLPPPDLTLNEGDSESWGVTFTPGATGVRHSTFFISVQGGASLEVPLSGTGNAPGGSVAGIDTDGGGTGADRDAGIGPGADDNTYYACATTSSGGRSWLLVALGVLLAVRRRKTRR